VKGKEGGAEKVKKARIDHKGFCKPMKGFWIFFFFFLLLWLELRATPSALAQDGFELQSS
jgi:hypothetical protein